MQIQRFKVSSAYLHICVVLTKASKYTVGQAAVHLHLPFWDIYATHLLAISQLTSQLKAPAKLTVAHFLPACVASWQAVQPCCHTNLQLMTYLTVSLQEPGLFFESGCEIKILIYPASLVQGRRQDRKSVV